jgi:hypothetical protein
MTKENASFNCSNFSQVPVPPRLLSCVFSASKAIFCKYKVGSGRSQRAYENSEDDRGGPVPEPQPVLCMSRNRVRAVFVSGKIVSDKMRCAETI